MKTANELLAIGEEWEERGDYERADRYYQRALALKEASVGVGHLELAPFLYNLGLIRWALDQYDGAETALKTLYAILRRALGEDHEDTLEVASLLMAVHMESKAAQSA